MAFACPCRARRFCSASPFSLQHNTATPGWFSARHSSCSRTRISNFTSRISHHCHFHIFFFLSFISLADPFFSFFFFVFVLHTATAIEQSSGMSELLIIGNLSKVVEGAVGDVPGPVVFDRWRCGRQKQADGSREAWCRWMRFEIYAADRIGSDRIGSD